MADKTLSSVYSALLVVIVLVMEGEGIKWEGEITRIAPAYRYNYL